MVAHRSAGCFQLRHLLPTARRRRVSLARRRGGHSRRAATAARRRFLQSDHRKAATSDGTYGRVHRGAGRRTRRRPPWCRSRSGGCARRRWCQRLVRRRRRADEAVCRTAEPHRGDRLAATHWRSDHRAAGSCGGGIPAIADRPEHRRVCLPEPDRHRAGLRDLVQRRSPPAVGRTAASRTCRARHRSGPRLARRRPVLVTAAAHRVRHHHWCHRVRCIARLGITGFSCARRASGGAVRRTCPVVRRAPHVRPRRRSRAWP